MKWIKIGKKPPTVTEDQSVSYDYYKDQLTIDTMMEIKRPGGQIGRRGNDPNPDRTQSHLWVNYPLGKEMGPSEQRDYEIFCGGFLVYHEKNIVTDIEYKIYFEWSLKGHLKPFSVSIYLSPAPAPRKRRKDISPLENAQANAGKNSSDEPTGPDTQIAFAAPPPAENTIQSIDPPKPPPPPPPPRD